jgi:hypothetical protein
MIKPLGGRGKKAPYETTQMRVPIPLKAQIESTIADYREQVLLETEDGEENEREPNEPDYSTEELLTMQAKKIQDLTSEVKYLNYKLSRVIEYSIKLVNRFIDESDQADKLHTRNNVNLVKFRNWLENLSDEDCDY